MPWERAAGTTITGYIDITLMNGTALHHNTKGGYNQVVLLPDALDMRPFRLLWYPGTVIYLIAGRSAHEECKKLLEVRFPVGCGISIEWSSQFHSIDATIDATESRPLSYCLATNMIGSQKNDGSMHFQC
jgi:hypothetical protein